VPDLRDVDIVEDGQGGGEAGCFLRGQRGGLAAAEGVDWEGGEGEEGWGWGAGGCCWGDVVVVDVFEVELGAAEVGLEAAGEAVGGKAGEVEVLEAHGGWSGFYQPTSLVCAGSWKVITAPGGLGRVGCCGGGMGE
jgi:hypothetical protein